jgi:hypothetical protein
MFLNAVDQQLLLLIETLSPRPEISPHFYLAGGTALALHLGHRTSADIDLFAAKPFNIERYSLVIIELGGRVLQSEEGSIHALTDGVRMSLLYYPYMLLRQLEIFQGLGVASIEDIAAMKAVAISQRGDKKDFFDMYEILKTMPVRDLKKLFLEKFSESRINCYHILKSLFYFADADRQPDPVSLNGTTWDQVKSYFVTHESEFMKELVC